MRLPLILLATLLVASFIASGCKDVLPPAPPSTIASDTIARWTFDGNLKDVTGHGHNALGAAIFGKTRNGIVTDQSVNLGGNAISVPSSNDLNMVTGNSYTVSAWVYTKDILSDSAKYPGGSILSKMPIQHSAEESGYQIGISYRSNNNQYKPVFFAAVDLSQNMLQLGNQGFEQWYPIGPDEWHLVTLVVLAHQHIDFYVDSILISSVPMEIKDQFANNDVPLTFGPLPDSSLVDDAMFLHRAMTADEVSARFHEGGWYAHHAPAPPIVGWQKGSFNTSEDIEGVCFTTPSVGYACGMNGALLQSTDSGNTWFKLNANTSQNLYRVSFRDQKNGIVGGNAGTLLITADEGRTWTQLTTPLTSSDNVRDLIYRQDLSGGVVRPEILVVGGSGSTGFVIRSTDDGITWQTLENTKGTLYGISRPDTVYIVGTQGQIFQTLNAWSSWTDVSQSWTGDNDFMAAALSSGFGIASSFEGGIYTLQNWQWTRTGSSGVTTQLRTAFVVEKQGTAEGFLAGQNGVILHTLDRGVSWKREDQNFSGAWNQIVQRDAHTIAFVGDKGTLYWYKH